MIFKFSRFAHFLDDMNLQSVEKFLALSPNIMQFCSKSIDKDNAYIRPESPPISKNMPTNWNHYGVTHIIFILITFKIINNYD